MKVLEGPVSHPTSDKIVEANESRKQRSLYLDSTPGPQRVSRMNLLNESGKGCLPRNACQVTVPGSEGTGYAFKPLRLRPIDVLKSNTPALLQTLPRAFDAPKKTRIMLQPVIKPVIL